MEVKLKSWPKAKRLREKPKNFSEIQSLVETHFQDVRDPQNNKLVQQLAQINKPTRDYTITYKDQDDEWINVSDDDDLQVAYMVATDNFNSKLQLHVQFKTPDQLTDLLNKSKILSNPEPIKSEEVSADPSKTKVKKEKKLKEKAAKKETKSAAKKALKKAMKALKEDKSLEEEKTARTAANMDVQTTSKNPDSDSDDSAGGNSSADEGQEPKQKCMAKKTGLPPRKALRCLIMKELDASAPFIFESLIKCKELG